MPAPRHWVLIVFLASALYAHLRGRVRFGLFRALTDFTVLFAPVNALMYLFSRAPKTPYLDPSRFAELQALQQNWQLIRDEALKLNDEGYIRAAATYNDVGCSRSEEHTSELQSPYELVCRLLLEKKNWQLGRESTGHF